MSERDKGKHKFICPGCEAIVWCRGTFRPMCGFCRKLMEKEESE
jgi:hypothetical protein